MLGEPTGLTAKLYLGGRPFALQFGLGWVDDDGFRDDDDDGLHIHAEAVWHPAILTRNSTFTMPFYVGVGGRILNDEDRYDCGGDTCVDDDTYIGVRVPFGLLMDFNRTPIDIFFELAVVVDLIELDDDDFDDDDHDRGHLNGAIGARYYF